MTRCEVRRGGSYDPLELELALVNSSRGDGDLLRVSHLCFCFVKYKLKVGFDSRLDLCLSRRLRPEVETVKQKREAGMPSSFYRRAGRPCVGGVAMLS